MDRRRSMLLISLGLVAAVLGVFLQTRHHAFVNYDDEDYVTRNRFVTEGLTVESLDWAIARSHADNWHPITWFSHMLDWKLFGDWAGGHHLVSVGLHSLTAVLLLVSLTRLTSELWPSAFVCAVFAIHPLRVESVAWVAERKDVLSGLFFALTLIAYAHYVKKPSLRRYMLVAFTFALGLMSKPMLVTLPCVLLLLDYWPLRRIVDAASFRKRVLEKLPMFALSVGSAIVTTIVQQDAMILGERLSLDMRIQNAVVSYAMYIVQTFWPEGLAVLYPHPKGNIPIAHVLGSAVFLLVLTCVAWGFRRRVPAILVGWLWYLGMLVPVIGLVQVGVQAHADRYTYLPQIGFLIAITWGFAALRLPSVVNAALAGGVLIACFILARQQTTVWQDSATLFTHTLAHTPPNPVAHTNLGAYFLKEHKYHESIEQSLLALALEPKDMSARKNLGLAYEHLGTQAAQQGNFAEAIAHYRTALEYDPMRLPVVPLLTSAHIDRGRELIRKQRLEEATREFQAAAEVDPDSVLAHDSLGTVLRERGQYETAAASFRRVLELNPHNVRAQANLDAVLQLLKKP